MAYRGKKSSINLKQSLCTDEISQKIHDFNDTSTHHVTDNGIVREGGITNIYEQVVSLGTYTNNQFIAADNGSIIGSNISGAVNNITVDGQSIGQLSPYGVQNRQDILNAQDIILTADNSYIAVYFTSGNNFGIITLTEYNQDTNAQINTKSITFMGLAAVIPTSVNVARYQNMHFLDFGNPISPMKFDVRVGNQLFLYDSSNPNYIQPRYSNLTPYLITAQGNWTNATGQTFVVFGTIDGRILSVDQNGNYKYPDGTGTGTGPFANQTVVSTNQINVIYQFQNQLIIGSNGGFIGSWDGTAWRNQDGSGVGTGIFSTSTVVSTNNISAMTIYNQWLYWTVLCVADVGGNLASKYWTFSAYSSTGVNTNYYVWYKVSGSGSDPALAGYTGIEVDISTGATANTVSTTTQTTLQARAPLTVGDAAPPTLTINTAYHPELGNVLTPIANNSGFTVTIISKAGPCLVVSGNATATTNGIIGFYNAFTNAWTAAGTGSATNVLNIGTGAYAAITNSSAINTLTLLTAGSVPYLAIGCSGGVVASYTGYGWQFYNATGHGTTLFTASAADVVNSQNILAATIYGGATITPEGFYDFNNVLGSATPTDSVIYTTAGGNSYFVVGGTSGRIASFDLQTGHWRKYDGTTFSGLSNGPNNTGTAVNSQTINKLLSSGNKLTVITTNYIASYDGSTNNGNWKNYDGSGTGMGAYDNNTIMGGLGNLNACSYLNGFLVATSNYQINNHWINYWIYISSYDGSNFNSPFEIGTGTYPCFNEYFYNLFNEVSLYEAPGFTSQSIGIISISSNIYCCSNWFGYSPVFSALGLQQNPSYLQTLLSYDGSNWAYPYSPNWQYGGTAPTKGGTGTKPWGVYVYETILSAYWNIQPVPFTTNYNSQIINIFSYNDIAVFCGYISNTLISSYDGSNWKYWDGSGIGTGPFYNSNGLFQSTSYIANCAADYLVGGTHYFIVGSSNGPGIASWDGSNWKNSDGTGTGTGPYNSGLVTNSVPTYAITSLTYNSNPTLVIAGGSSNEYIASFVPTNLASNLTWYPYNYFVQASGVYVVGSATGLISSYDGSNWKTYSGGGSGTGMFDNQTIVGTSNITDFVQFPYNNANILGILGVNGRLGSWDGTHKGLFSGIYVDGLYTNQIYMGTANVTASVVFGNYLVVGGSNGWIASFDTVNNYWKWFDGYSNSTSNGPYNNGTAINYETVQKLLVLSGKLIVVSQHYIGSYDGTNWKNWDGSGCGTGPYDNNTARVGNVSDVCIFGSYLICTSTNYTTATGYKTQQIIAPQTTTGQVTQYYNVYYPYGYSKHYFYVSSCNATNVWKYYNGSGSGTGPYLSIQGEDASNWFWQGPNTPSFINASLSTSLDYNGQPVPNTVVNDSTGYYTLLPPLVTIANTFQQQISCSSYSTQLVVYTTMQSYYNGASAWQTLELFSYDGSNWKLYNGHVTHTFPFENNIFIPTQFGVFPASGGGTGLAGTLSILGSAGLPPNDLHQSWGQTKIGTYGIANATSFQVSQLGNWNNYLVITGTDASLNTVVSSYNGTWRYENNTGGGTGPWYFGSNLLPSAAITNIIDYAPSAHYMVVCANGGTGIASWDGAAYGGSGAWINTAGTIITIGIGTAPAGPYNSGTVVNSQNTFATVPLTWSATYYLAVVGANGYIGNLTGTTWQNFNTIGVLTNYYHKFAYQNLDFGNSTSINYWNNKLIATGMVVGGTALGTDAVFCYNIGNNQWERVYNNKNVIPAFFWSGSEPIPNTAQPLIVQYGKYLVYILSIAGSGLWVNSYDGTSWRFWDGSGSGSGPYGVNDGSNKKCGFGSVQQSATYGPFGATITTASQVYVAINYNGWLVLAGQGGNVCSFDGTYWKASDGNGSGAGCSTNAFQ